MAILAVRVVKARLEAFAAMLPRRTSDGDSLVLAYHNVVPRDETGLGESSLHLSLEDFEAQLQVAKREGDLVGLSELLRYHGHPGRRIAISFDDAYAGCVRWGLPACTSAGIRPVIFVAPAILGHYMPWDLLAAQSQWSDRHRMSFLKSGGVASSEMSANAHNLLPESYRIATLEEIRLATTHHEFDVANHTFRHINVGVSTRESTVDEIVRAEDFLLSQFADRIVPRCIAYPYGLAPKSFDATSLTRHVSTAFMVEGGWQTRHQSIVGFRVNRLNIPSGISHQRFRAQLRGWLS